MNKLITILTNEIKLFFKIQKSEREWHIPFLASFCTAVPLFLGLYFNKITYGSLAYMSAFIPNKSLPIKMITILACSFGFMFAYTLGLLFSFNFLLSSIVLASFSFFIHWITLYFKMKSPGSFFFIMLASIASCTPFELGSLYIKVGILALGVMFAATCALIYSFFITKTKSKFDNSSIFLEIHKSKYKNLAESIIIGIFVFISSISGHLLNLQNPYWVTISCTTIMMGASIYHIIKKSIYRIVGTFLGLGSSLILLLINKNLFTICITITILQFLIETIVVRHYALAAMFFTPLTILLTEINNPQLTNPQLIISARFWNIFLGSLLGLVGGVLIHNEKVKQKTIIQIRKTRIAFKKFN